MRWDNLFDDLEGQLEQELTAEEVDLQAEEERLRLGRLSVRDRILSIHDASDPTAPYSIRLELTNGEQVAVRPAAFGRDWFSGDLPETGTRSQCIIPIAAIAGLVLDAAQVTASLNSGPGEDAARSLSARLGLRFVLRDLCRRRTWVELRTPTGVLRGTIDRIGRDHLDLAVHDADQPRRQSAVTQHRVVHFSQLLLVRV